MNNNFRTIRGYELKGYNKSILTPALEDYLEMIYRNNLEEDYIRVGALAHLLNVKDSSASKMVKKLGELGLVKYERYGIVILTEEGKMEGKFLLDRHNIIEKFLYFIGCKESSLVQTELIEHFIAPDTVEKIEILFNYLNSNEDILDGYLNNRETSLKYKK